MESWQHRFSRRKLLGLDRKQEMLSLVQGSIDAAEEARNAARAAADAWQAEPAIRLPRRSSRRKAQTKRRRQMGAAVAALLAISTAAGGAAALINGADAVAPPQSTLTAPASYPEASLRDLLAEALTSVQASVLDAVPEGPRDEAAAVVLSPGRTASSAPVRTSATPAPAVTADMFNRPSYQYQFEVQVVPLAFEGDLTPGASASNATQASDVATADAAAPTTTMVAASTFRPGKGKGRSK